VSRRVKFLIDECLHTSLVKVATDRLYEAYHVAHLGLSGLKDDELMTRVRNEDFTLVTNNAIDFRRLFGKEPIHAGFVIIVPNVVPAIQRALFVAVLDYIGNRDLVNRAIEINLSRDTTEIEEYEILPQDAADDQIP
jgi:predicted nuclease of predicted toxin-antitoxin system